MIMTFSRLITPYNRTELKNKENKYLIIHYVGAVSTAENNARYFFNAYRGASAHYFVDEKSIWQVVEEKDAAWHIGGAKVYYNNARNNNSIGIEMCCKQKDGVWYIEPETIENTLWLASTILKRYGLSVKNCFRHWDCTKKRCPEPFVRDEKQWIDFLSRLEKMMNDSIENELDALDYLAKDGVISSTNYWKDALPYYKNLNFLLVKVANRIKKLKSKNGLK